MNQTATWTAARVAMAIRDGATSVEVIEAEAGCEINPSVYRFGDGSTLVVEGRQLFALPPDVHSFRIGARQSPDWNG